MKPTPLTRVAAVTRILTIMLASVLVALASPATHAFEKSRDLSAMSVAELPKEGRETLALIRKGGPHPYSKDGTIFSNREKILPRQPRGFYHEYTVKTPGSRDRGARRIVCGGKQQETCYYTGDHYASFKIIKE